LSLFSSLRRVFYGHWIVAVTFLCLTVAMGCGSFVYSLFVQPLQESMSWSRGQIMAGYTVFFVTMGLVSPLVGRIVDRQGARRVMPLGALIMGLGFALVSVMQELYVLYLGYVLVGIGAAGFASVPCSAVVSNWFKKSRGTAIGLMSSGIGAGGVIMPPVVEHFLGTSGWRGAYFALAVIVWVSVIPLVLLVIRTKPSDLGLCPDGVAQPPAAASGVRGSSNEGMPLRAAVVTAAFWLIAMSFVLSAFGRMGALQSQGPNLIDLGFPAATAALGLSIIGFGSGVGKFIFGWLCDRMSLKAAGAIGMVLQSAGVVVLLTVTSRSPDIAIWTYSLLLGLGAGSWLPIVSMLTSSSFGLRHYGSIYGLISLMLNIGTAAGPLVAGLMFDALGSYRAAFIICAALCAAAVPMVLLVRRPAGPHAPAG
jgi:MFS family permease